MPIQICPQVFDPYQVLTDYQAERLPPGQYGACGIFIGTMREFNLGVEVTELLLDYYPEMTEKLLTEYAQKVQKDYVLLDILVLHRVGKIKPNDPIVLVATWSVHRAEAFDGCRDMMEYLKAKATFWKKEVVTETNQQRWVGNI